MIAPTIFHSIGVTREKLHHVWICNVDGVVGVSCLIRIDIENLIHHQLNGSTRTITFSRGCSSTLSLLHETSDAPRARVAPIKAKVRRVFIRPIRILLGLGSSR
ncbi:hypothetical protein CGBL_0108140 [Corynebacterium glutamicum]|nr:hypothetical protein CGBL_0108140 [Corynebacterium glutamicum]